MKIYVISIGDKITGPNNTTTICGLHSSLEEVLKFISLVKINMSFVRPSFWIPSRDISLCEPQIMSPRIDGEIYRWKKLSYSTCLENEICG